MSDASVLRPLADAVALIDEQRCIGCTLCIHACPVDAIVGAAKLMHTVIADACTGCELCVPPCPVDCIVIAELEPRTSELRTSAEADALTRYERRNARLHRQREQRTARLQRERKKREVIARAMARAKERLDKSAT